MPQAFRIVLVEPSFEESIGFIARAMKNFGLNSLHLVNPNTELGSNGRMRGGHAQDILDRIVIDDSLSDALDGLDVSIGTTAQKGFLSSNLLRKPMTPRQVSESIASLSGKIGIVFGREGTGLNNHEISLCDMVVTIPADKAYSTLNLSHAAAIIFYELYQSRVPDTDGDIASEEVKRTILGFMSNALARARMPEYRIGLTIRAMRSVLGRSIVRRREASLLAGGFRQISTASSTIQKRESRMEALSGLKPQREG